METVDVGEVGPEAPQPTHINVHIHQESALAKLLLAGCSALRGPASASTWSLDSSRLLVASWVREATFLMGPGEGHSLGLRKVPFSCWATISPGLPLCLRHRVGWIFLLETVQAAGAAISCG